MARTWQAKWLRLRQMKSALVSSAGPSRSRKSPFAIILNQFTLPTGLTAPQTAPSPIFIPFPLFLLLGLVSLCHMVSVVFTEGMQSNIPSLAAGSSGWHFFGCTKAISEPRSSLYLVHGFLTWSNLTSGAQLLPGYV